MSNTVVPIVFAFDGRVLRAAAVAMISLLEAADTDTIYEIHILHPGFKQTLIDAFDSIVSDTRHVVVFHTVDKKMLASLPAGRGSWTEIVYYRFLIPEILKNYNRAIYSDIDVFFKGDLSSLMHLDMKGAPIGAVVGETNNPSMKCHTYFPENLSEHIFMSGFLLMDLNRMREEGLSRKLISTARAFGGRLKMFDLDALNLTCDNILPLPFDYCVLETVFEAQSVRDAPEFSWLSDYYSEDTLDAAKDNVKIIHYAGPLGKPWRRPNQPTYYTQALERIPSALNKKTARDIRKYWTNRIATTLQKILSP